MQLKIVTVRDQQLKSSKIEEFLENNDRFGEQCIALVQSIMAGIVVILHGISASRSAWETLNFSTLFVGFLIIAVSLYRLRLSQDEIFKRNMFHVLTIVDGVLIFCLLLSYNSAYNLELAATFKAPSMILFVAYTATRLLRFDPTSIFVAGGTVLGGWTALFAVAYFGERKITTDYVEYLMSQKLMIGAAFEMALGYAIFLFVLAFATSGARRFVARTAMVEELEAANRRAEESAEEFEDLFSSSSDGILIVNQYGGIEKANHALEELFGYDEGELVGKNASLLMSDMHAQGLKLGIEQYLVNGKSPLVGKTYESQGVRKNGNHLDIELSINEFRASSGEIRFAGFIRDIMARKNAEKNERNAVARFQNAVDAAMDAIIIIDENGDIVGFNPAAEEIFGFKNEQVVGQKLSEIIIPERYREAHEQGMQHYLKTGEAPVLNSRIEIEGLNSEGEEMLIELAIREIDGETGRLFFGYARDIRDRKNAEQELISAKNEAEQALNAKGRFLAMMSHEIRTPLNGVLGIVNLLEDTDLTEDQQELLHVARDSGQSLLAIINDILDFSKLEVGKFNIESAPFELNTLLDSVVALVQPIASEKGLDISHNINSTLKQAYLGDADRLRQVLLNMIWNAIKFTDEGGIVVSITQGESDSIRFEVQDTGIGIASEQIDKLFKEFSTLDDHRASKMSGTGLGLAISKSLIDAMNGKIGVTSESGDGSTFWFEVPLPVSSANHANEPRSQCLKADHVALDGVRVLVAEDNVTNQLITRSFLTRVGCRVDVANNGFEAVELSRSVDYDVILMDISMPEMDGFTATEKIRLVEADSEIQIPIIAFTAYASKEDRQEILDRGMNGFVTKPFTKDQLLTTLAENLAYKSAPMNVKIEDEPIVSEILDQLLEGNNQETQLQLLQQFSDDMGRYRDLVEQGLAETDWNAVERASHGIKGSAGMFGATALSELAETVNKLCHSNAIISESETAVELVRLTQSVLQSVENLKKQKSSMFNRATIIGGQQ